MTTIYLPVPITSTEQAEALPVGTVAVEFEGALGDAWSKGTLFNDQVWPLATNEDETYTNAQMVGLSYLVPIEVEVEQIRETAGRRREKTLYVTPWTTPDAELGDEGEALADCGDGA